MRKMDNLFFYVWIRKTNRRTDGGDRDTIRQSAFDETVFQTQPEPYALCVRSELGSLS
jgi:hypothetical protein